MTSESTLRRLRTAPIALALAWLGVACSGSAALAPDMGASSAHERSDAPFTQNADSDGASLDVDVDVEASAPDVDRPDASVGGPSCDELVTRTNVAGDLAAFDLGFDNGVRLEPLSGSELLDLYRRCKVP